MKPVFLISVVSMVASLAALPMASAASAGNSSHGGRMWICAQPDGSKTYELFDYRIGQEELGLSYDFDAHPADPSVDTDAAAIEIAENLAKRLETVEPAYAHLLESRVAGFMDRVEFTTNEYINLGDMNEVLTKPINCDYKQVVNQLPYDTKDPLKFKITTQFWNELNAHQRAGLILHELAYEDGVAQGNDKSDGVMRMNAYLASTVMPEITPSDWLKLMVEYELPYHSANGFVFDSATVQMDASGKIAKGTLTQSLDPTQNRIYLGTAAIPLSDQNILTYHSKNIVAELKNPIQINNADANLSLVESVELDPNGLVESSFTSGGCVHVHGAQASHGDCVVVDSGAVDFHKNGRVLRFMPAEEFAVSYADESVRFDEAPYMTHAHVYTQVDRSVLLDSEQNVFSAILRRSHEFRDQTGDQRRAYRYERVYLLSDGRFATPGIYSVQGDDPFFIHMVQVNGSHWAFAVCSIESPDTCTQIGSGQGYSKEDLKRLHLNMSDEAFGGNGAVDYLSGLGLTEDLLDWTLDSSGSGFRKAGGIIAAVALVPVNVALEIAETPFAWLANKIFGHHRAKKHMLKDHYVVVNASILDLVDQLRKQLGEIRPEPQS